MTLGRRTEQRVARELGGKARPDSGRGGGGDIAFADEELWDAFRWEVKARARAPHILRAALEQADATIAIGDQRRPAVAFQEEGGQIVVAFYWRDLSTFVEALAELGSGGRIRRLAEQIEKAARDVRRLAR